METIMKRTEQNVWAEICFWVGRLNMKPRQNISVSTAAGQAQGRVWGSARAGRSCGAGGLTGCQGCGGRLVPVLGMQRGGGKFGCFSRKHHQSSCVQLCTEPFAQSHLHRVNCIELIAQSYLTQSQLRRVICAEPTLSRATCTEPPGMRVCQLLLVLLICCARLAKAKPSVSQHYFARS